MSPADRNAANLSASLEFYGRCAPGAAWTAGNGIKLISSGVSTSVFNIALLTAAVPDQPGALERRVDAAAAWFRRRGTGWSFWVCEDLLPARAARRAHEVFDRHGLACIAESPGMETPCLAPPSRPLPKLDLRRVGDAHSRLAFVELISLAFQIPYPVAQAVYDHEAAWDSPLRAYVGYTGGVPVACVALIDTGETAGIYSVATRPERRHEGFAESVMRAGLEDFGSPAPALVLQSSSSGLRMYQRLGFRRTTRFFIYSTS